MVSGSYCHCKRRKPEEQMMIRRPGRTGDPPEAAPRDGRARSKLEASSSSGKHVKDSSLRAGSGVMPGTLTPTGDNVPMAGLLITSTLAPRK